MYGHRHASRAPGRTPASRRQHEDDRERDGSEPSPRAANLPSAPWAPWTSPPAGAPRPGPRGRSSTPTATTATAGDVEHRFELASVTKLLTALAALVAVEEGTVGPRRPGRAAGGDGAPPARPRRRLRLRRRRADRRRRVGGGSTRTPATRCSPTTSPPPPAMPFADYLGEAVLAAARPRGHDPRRLPRRRRDRAASATSCASAASCWRRR